MTTKTRIRRHLIGLSFMTMGTFGVFFLLHVMNADEGPPQEKTESKAASFAVEKKKPPKKKKTKPKAPPKKARASAPRAPTPNLGPALRGVSFDLPGFSGGEMGDAGQSLLGETNKKMAMTEGAVDVAPKAARRVQPEYPKRARERGDTGYVRMSIFVDDAGRVDRVRVLDAKPRGVFEDAAKSAVQSWEFSPGQYEGEAVGTWVTQTMRFELKKS